MTLQQIAEHCITQQKLQGRLDAAVTFILSGSWPNGGKKRLLGRWGPLGRCLAEYEDSCLVEFSSAAVMKFLYSRCDYAPLQLDAGNSAVHRLGDAERSLPT